MHLFITYPGNRSGKDIKKGNPLCRLPLYKFVEFLELESYPEIQVSNAITELRHNCHIIREIVSRAEEE